jgi:uncharacterized membrane protein
MTFNREPVVWVAMIEAALLLISAFGFHLTGQQIAAIGAVVTALTAIVVVRPRTVAMAKLKDPADLRKVLNEHVPQATLRSAGLTPPAGPGTAVSPGGIGGR